MVREVVHDVLFLIRILDSCREMSRRRYLR